MNFIMQNHSFCVAVLLLPCITEPQKSNATMKALVNAFYGGQTYTDDTFLI